MDTMRRLIWKKAISGGGGGKAVEILSAGTRLVPDAVRDAMEKGSVWISRKGKTERLRAASYQLAAGDVIELYYDEALLGNVPPEPECISDQIKYSVWNKPAGLLSQGTRFGDHCSLLRYAERYFRPERKAYLVHRLDREVQGIMLIAHTRAAAEELSRLFREQKISKTYSALVLGKVGDAGATARIDAALDGKPALTEYRIDAWLPEKNATLVTVMIRTGRLHQIRRHFEMTGHPVIGDPRYGKGNKNREGILLKAVSLGFRCPFQKRDVEFALQGQGFPDSTATSTGC